MSELCPFCHSASAQRLDLLVHLSPVGGSLCREMAGLQLAGAGGTRNFCSCGLGVRVGTLGWASGLLEQLESLSAQLEGPGLGLGPLTTPRSAVVPCSSRGCSRRSRNSDTGTFPRPSAWTSCGTSRTTAWNTGARTRRAWRRPAAFSSNGSPSCAGGRGAAGGRALVGLAAWPNPVPTCLQVCACGSAGATPTEDQRAAPLLPGPRLPGDTHGQPEGNRLDPH